MLSVRCGPLTRFASELLLAFGSELQLERERREISLASIAEVTKVPLRYLAALETEQFDELPGGILTKGILRGYCRQVGLDEAEWLGRMPESRMEQPLPALAEFAENVSRSRNHPRVGMGMRWWGVLLMLLCLGALGWSAWHYVVQPTVTPFPTMDARSDTNGPATKDSETEDTPGVTPATVPAAQPDTQPGAQPAPAAMVAPSSAAQPELP